MHQAVTAVRGLVTARSLDILLLLHPVSSTAFIPDPKYLVSHRRLASWAEGSSQPLLALQSPPEAAWHRP